MGAAWYARLSRDDRVRAAANHHRLQPHLDHAAAAALARRSYQEYVRMIVDSMWAEPLDSAQVLELFRVIGAEHLDVGDRGSMVVLPHFGNWDMAASASLGLGLHLSTVMAPVVSPGITEMVALSRQRKGLEIFTVRQSARGLFRALATGEDGRADARRPRGGSDRGGAVLRRTGALQRRPGASRGGHGRADPPGHLPARWSGMGARDPSAGRHVRRRCGGDRTDRGEVEPAIRAHPEQWYPFHHVYDDR